MNTLLVYMVNPQDIEQANAFLLANNGRELSPDSGWWRIETDMSFKHAFFSCGIGWEIRDSCASSNWAGRDNPSPFRRINDPSYSNPKAF